MTGGSHAGVMKYVGQAVRDQALSSRSTHGQMVAIGMASWGAIHNRQALVQKVGGTRDTHTARSLPCKLDNAHCVLFGGKWFSI